MSLEVSHVGRSNLYFSPIFPSTLEKLLKIREVFTENAPFHNQEELEEVCFTAVVKACRNNEWDKIRKLSETILGLQDAQGKSLYEALIEEGNLDSIACLKEDSVLRRVLSNSQFNFGLHIAARKAQTAIFHQLIKPAASEALILKIGRVKPQFILS